MVKEAGGGEFSDPVRPKIMRKNCDIIDNFQKEAKICNEVALKEKKSRKFVNFGENNALLRKIMR